MLAEVCTALRLQIQEICGRFDGMKIALYIMKPLPPLEHLL
jgi:hypothetical protein